MFAAPKSAMRREFLRNSVAIGAGLAPLQYAAAASPFPDHKMSPVAPIVAQEYWANKNGVKLWVYRKYSGPSDAQRPLLFLVHGSSYSGKTMFDLQVPERTGYSFMDRFAQLGFDVWTMDHGP